MYVSKNSSGSVIYQSLFTFTYDIVDVVTAPVIFSSSDPITTTDVYNVTLKSPNYALINGTCTHAIPLDDKDIKELNDNIPSLNLQVLENCGKLQVNSKEVGKLICAYEGMHFRSGDIDPLLIPFSNYYSMYIQTQNIRYYTPSPSQYGLIVGNSDAYGKISPNITINEPSASLTGRNCPIVNLDVPAYLGVCISPYFSQWSAYLVSKLSELTVKFSYHAEYLCYVKLTEKDNITDLNMDSPSWRFQKGHIINVITSYNTTGEVVYPFTNQSFRGDSLCVLPYHTNYPYDSRPQYEFHAEDFVKMLDPDTDITKQVMDNIGGRCYKLHPEFDRYNAVATKTYIYATVYKDIYFERPFNDLTSLTHNYELAMYLKQFIIGNPNYLTWWYNSSNSLKDQNGHTISNTSFVFKFNERFEFNMS